MATKTWLCVYEGGGWLPCLLKFFQTAICLCDYSVNLHDKFWTLGPTEKKNNQLKLVSDLVKFVELNTRTSAKQSQ